MATSENIVIVADDHPLIGMALRLSIQAVDPAIEIVTVEDFAALRQAIGRTGDARLVLLDLLMPDVEGLSALQFLRDRHPRTPVAVISAIREPMWPRAAEALGAVAFVPKTTDAGTMQDILQQLLDGGTWWPSRALDANAAQVSSDIDHRLDRLTQQELRILLQVKDGRLNKQIAGDLGISESTIKTHVSSILLKLDLRSRTQAAVLAQKLLTWHPEPVCEE